MCDARDHGRAKVAAQKDTPHGLLPLHGQPGPSCPSLSVRQSLEVTTATFPRHPLVLGAALANSVTRGAPRVVPLHGDMPRGQPDTLTLDHRRGVVCGAQFFHGIPMGTTCLPIFTGRPG